MATAARPSAAALRVVATTEDLASLAREVGGDKVTVVALAKGYQDPHFVDPKPSFILEVSRADLLIVVGRELEIGWLPPLINEQPQREDPAGRQWLSRCVGQREDPRDSDRPDHARDGRRAPAGQPPLLARPGQRPPHRADDQGQAGPALAGRSRLLRTALRGLRQAAGRGREPLGRDDGAVQGHENRDLPPLVAELHGALRVERDRLRRAEARHSADDLPHGRAHRRDEEAGRQAHRRGAVLRS